MVAMNLFTSPKFMLEFTVVLIFFMKETLEFAVVFDTKVTVLPQVKSKKSGWP